MRVRIAYSGVNPTDWKARSGTVPQPRATHFQVPHHDGAGVIDEVGPGVDPARVGERVWLYLAAYKRPWGTAAQFTVIPSDQAIPLPDGASIELGASLGVPAVTAHRCLFADGAARRPHGARRRRRRRGRPLRDPAGPGGRRDRDQHCLR